MWVNGVRMKPRDRSLSPPITLADIPSGMLVRILNMDKLPVEKRDHLLAFGLTPGRWVEIKQHRPAVVAQVDYTELALEPDVACNILVETPVPLRRLRHLRRGVAARGRRHRQRPFFRRKRRRRRHRLFSWIMRRRDQSKKE
jgi:Fe2+ transport system protein FeoA